MELIVDGLLEDRSRFESDTPFSQALAAAEKVVHGEGDDDDDFPESESDEECEGLYLPALTYDDRNMPKVLRTATQHFNLYTRMLGTKTESTRAHARAVKALKTKNEIDKLYDLLCKKVNEFAYDVSYLGSSAESSISDHWYRNVDDWTEYDIDNLRHTFEGPQCGHHPMHVYDPKDYELYLREWLPRAALRPPTQEERHSRSFFHKVDVLISKIRGNVIFDRPWHFDRQMHLWVFAIARVFPPSNLRCARLTHAEPECAFREVRFLLNQCRNTDDDKDLHYWDMAAAFRDLNAGWLEIIRNLVDCADYWRKTYHLLLRLRDLAEEEIRFNVELALSNDHMPSLPVELKELIFHTTMMAEAVPPEVQL